MNKKTKISIFFDGYFFDLLSRYYRFGHRLQRWIDFAGLDAYILTNTAEAIGVNEKNCAIIGKHLYKGVLSARDVTPEQAKKANDYSDLLKKHNITPHFRDLWTNGEGYKKEKMVDPDLICDALEMAFKREFDVLVLIACDTDFVPMVEKLNKWAIDSVLFWWDLPEYEFNGKKHNPQRTSDLLIRTVKHHFEMNPIADKRKKTELEENIFSKPRFPIQGYDTDEPKMSTPDKAERPSVEQLSRVDKIETLVMNFKPRELTEEELRKTWVSSVISINQEDGWGYVKGPVAFTDPALNNFQFGTQDIVSRKITDFEIGMKINFKLKPDPKRSERLGHPLYRAYDINLRDPPVSSVQLEQSEPKAPKPDPASSLPATQEKEDQPVSPERSIPSEFEKDTSKNLSEERGKESGMVKQKIDLPKEEVGDHLIEADEEVLRQRPVAATGRVGGKYVVSGTDECCRPHPILIKHPIVDSAANSEMRQRRCIKVVAQKPCANVDSYRPLLPKVIPNRREEK